MILSQKIEKIRNQLLNEPNSLYSYLSNTEKNKYLLDNIDENKLGLIEDIINLWKRELDPDYIVNFKYYVYQYDKDVICIELYMQVENSIRIINYEIIISPKEVKVLDLDD